MGFGEMMKAAASKALVIKINLVFLAFFLVLYVGILLQPETVYDQNVRSTARCSLHDCLMMKKTEAKMVKKSTVVVGETKRPAPMKEIPAILKRFQDEDIRIGLVNIDASDYSVDWESIGKPTFVEFEPASPNFKWNDLFPEWIDEEEENEGPSCPEIPMPDFSLYEEVDVVVARVPCGRPEAGWARDVLRLQVHLVAANLAARRGKRDGMSGKVRVVVESECRPMVEMFRCDDVAGREGRWWLFVVDGVRLEEKVALPVGSCKLALPLWQEGTNEEYDISKINALQAPATRREAYATVLHSSSNYVCGAIALAQSIIKTGTTRDLVLLHDASIPRPKLDALAAAGWKLQLITRIRNPRAQRHSYNEYNYSKFRLWQLTYYHKVVFVDADIVVLRSLDVLFRFPQLSAVGNDGVIFNSGVMVLEPSNCTFKILMRRRKDIISYNGGDQGYLNEIFVWWHRLPRRVNFLKNFWSNKSSEYARKNALFGSDPPELYAIHYLGLKPWLCHREYDCNWNIEDQKVYASDVAHRRWWKAHDAMDGGLKGFCGLSRERKEQLEGDRKNAERLGFSDGHWRMKVE